jgi:hypothetical protein
MIQIRNKKHKEVTMADPQELQNVHQCVLRHFIETGCAPHFTEMPEKLGVDLHRARQLIKETIDESPFSFAWLVPDTDYIAAWAPFSNIPNHNLISVDGVQKWHGV